MEEGSLLDLFLLILHVELLTFIFSWLFGLQLELVSSTTHVLGNNSGPCKMLWLKSPDKGRVDGSIC